MLALRETVQAVPTYGENLKRLRAGRSQETVAKRMNRARQGNLPQYENDVKFPDPETVMRHAFGLDVKPSRLLQGVPTLTLYDRIRNGEFDDGEKGRARFAQIVREMKEKKKEARKRPRPVAADGRPRRKRAGDDRATG